MNLQKKGYAIPLVLLGILFGNKRTNNKFKKIIILAIIVISIGMTFYMVCNPHISSVLASTDETPFEPPDPIPPAANDDIICDSNTYSPNTPTEEQWINDFCTAQSENHFPYPSVFGLEVPKKDNYNQCIEDLHDQWRTIDEFNLSAYYVTHETQFYPYDGSQSNPIPSLNNRSFNKYFLYSTEGVCYAGTGRTKDGKLIGCIEKLDWPGYINEIATYKDGQWPYQMPVNQNNLENTNFFWKTQAQVDELVTPFETVAVCKSGPLGYLIDGRQEIRIVGLTDTLKKDVNYSLFSDIIRGKDDIFKVTDAGGGLCATKGIDVYVGELGPWTGSLPPERRLSTAIIGVDSITVEARVK